MLALAAGAVLLVIGLVVGMVTPLQPGQRRSTRVTADLDALTNDSQGG
jgi:hypothetical protein